MHNFTLSDSYRQFTRKNFKPRIKNKFFALFTDNQNQKSTILFYFANVCLVGIPGFREKANIDGYVISTHDLGQGWYLVGETRMKHGR